MECFYLLLWFYSVTDSEFRCLAKLAKPYPLSDLTYLPQIPNQHHCIPKGAHEVLRTISEARHMSIFHIKIICFIQF